MDVIQGGVNTLVPLIEFFRLQSERYPVSLREILEGPVGHKEWAPVVVDNPLFRCELSSDGNRYTLVHAGADHEFGTTDDIVPLIPKVAGSRIGLVR